MIGDLPFFLNTISIPGAGSEAFVVPSAADRQAFGGTVAALLRFDLPAATALADDLGYDLIEFTHVFSLRPYYILKERDGGAFRGLGTYVFNPGYRRQLNIQSPHVPSDANTGPESVELFMEVDALFLAINGTHRCANAQSSPCDGMTETCSEDEAPHRISDTPHFAGNFFQVASDRAAAVRPTIVALQIHSFSVGCGQVVEVTPPAQISNGACASCANHDCDPVPDSLCTQIALEINDRLTAAGYPGRGAASWNATAWDPAEVQIPADMCREFCGNTSTQGRSLNGSVDPCEDGIRSAPRPERFVHIEQLPLLTRAGPGGPDYPGVSRQITIDSIAAVFPAPSQRWVDFDHQELEDGAFATPHNSLAEALDHAAPGEMLRIKAGSSPETPVIRRRILLKGYDGPVTIGG